MTRARAGHGAVLGVAAPATFVLLWSTGFVGAKFGLPYAEPLTFLAVRLAIASAILALVTAATRAPLPSTAGGYVQAAIAGLSNGRGDARVSIGAWNVDAQPHASLR